MSNEFQTDGNHGNYILTFVADVTRKSTMNRLKDDGIEVFPLEGTMDGAAFVHSDSEPTNETIERLCMEILKKNNQDVSCDMYIADILGTGIRKIN